MAEKRKYPNPTKFRSLEEERQYWEKHSPLVEGYEGKMQRGSQKLSSYFALRLTGEEITRLRDAAAKNNQTISAFARQVLMAAVEKVEHPSKPITVEELGTLLEQRLPPSIKERLISLVKESSIPDEEKPAMLLIDASQMKAWEEIVGILLPLLLSLAGFKVVSPQSKEYATLKEMAGS